MNQFIKRVGKNPHPLDVPVCAVPGRLYDTVLNARVSRAKEVVAYPPILQ